MIVGLVALLVLFAGILLLARLARAHTQAMLDAREEAGSFAMGQSFGSGGSAPQFIYDWSPGPDEETHSQDDVVIPAVADPLHHDILAHAKPADLRLRLPDNQISDMYQSSDFLEGFSLVQGRKETDKIYLPPIIRELLYNDAYIQIEANVWLTWSKGLE